MVEVDLGRVSALIRKIEPVIAGGILLADVLNPILSLVVVMEQFGRLLGIKGWNGGFWSAATGGEQQETAETRESGHSRHRSARGHGELRRSEKWGQTAALFLGHCISR